MVLKKIGIPSVVHDNDMQYMSRLFKLIEGIDDQATIVVIHNHLGYDFTITCSSIDLRMDAKKELKEFHRMLGLYIKFNPSVPMALMFFQQKFG